MTNILLWMLYLINVSFPIILNLKLRVMSLLPIFINYLKIQPNQAILSNFKNFKL